MDPQTYNINSEMIKMYSISHSLEWIGDPDHLRFFCCIMQQVMTNADKNVIVTPMIKEHCTDISVEFSCSDWAKAIKTHKDMYPEAWNTKKVKPELQENVDQTGKKKRINFICPKCSGNYEINEVTTQEYTDITHINFDGQTNIRDHTNKSTIYRCSNCKYELPMGSGKFLYCWLKENDMLDCRKDMKVSTETEHITSENISARNKHMDIETLPLHFKISFNVEDYYINSCITSLRDHCASVRVCSLGDPSEMHMEIDFHTYMPENDYRALINTAFTENQK